MKYLEAIQHKSPRKSKAFMVAKKVKKLERRLSTEDQMGLDLGSWIRVIQQWVKMQRSRGG